MGKNGTQLLRHCVHILVRVTSDLFAVRLSGIGCFLPSVPSVPNVKYHIQLVLSYDSISLAIGFVILALLFILIFFKLVTFKLLMQALGRL